MSDAGGFSVQTGGTRKDFFASMQDHTTAISVQLQGNVSKWKRLSR